MCQSVRTIQKWRVTGAGPHFYKFASSVRYRRRDLNRMGRGSPQGKHLSVIQLCANPSFALWHLAVAVATRILGPEGI
jgi:hypothetical protein